MRFATFLKAAFLITFINLANGAETITLNGQKIRNCDLVELSRDGPIYHCGDDDSLYTVPWPQLTPLQQDKIRNQFNEALVNIICDARYINGTVFHANQDGVIIQITIDAENDPYTKEGINGYYKGATVPRGGLVLISDLPIDVPRSAGDRITMFAYFKEKRIFSLGIAEKEIEHLTVAKPDWFQISEWKNSAGQAMKAKLLGVKDDKVLFSKEDGSRFTYSLSQLDAESRKRATETQARLAGFPVP